LIQPIRLAIAPHLSNIDPSFLQMEEERTTTDLGGAAQNNAGKNLTKKQQAAAYKNKKPQSTEREKRTKRLWMTS
jgi:hypothetical protein